MLCGGTVGDWQVQLGSTAGLVGVGALRKAMQHCRIFWAAVHCGG